MKFSITFLLFSILGLQVVLAHNGYGQGLEDEMVTLGVKSKQLPEVLKEIEKQTDYRFAYNADQIAGYLVDLDLGKRNLGETLNMILADKPLQYKVVKDKFIVVSVVQKRIYSSVVKPLNSLKLNYQVLKIVPQNVSGTVTDETGEPLIGVNVQVKGTNKGTATDFVGNFTLEDIDENAVLVVSYIGYQTQEVAVAGKSNLSITLTSDSQLLDEVVVVGYGTMKKSDLTGSVVTADLESFRGTANNNIAQSLQGTVPGLNVGVSTKQGSEPSMSIRGLNTLGGSTSPLIVLDDVIFRGRLIDINPDDIESVTVLKDASSAAIYGSQAANGVIIITSKKAKTTGKPTFTYSGNIGFQKPTQLWTPMNREQFLQKNKDVWWRKAYTKESGYLEPNSAWNDGEALVTIHQGEGYTDGTDTDWKEFGIRTGILGDHNLSMQAKENGLSSYLSLGYTDSKGYVQNDNFKRFSVRSNIDYDIYDWFKVGAQTFLTVSDYEGRETSLWSIMTKSPLSKALNEDGSIYLYPDGFLTPLYFQQTDQLDKYNTLYGNFYASIEVPFVKGLTYKLNYTPNYRQHRLYTYNPYSNSETGAAQKRQWNDFDYAFDQRINYKQNFWVNHSIDFTLAAGREKRTDDFTDALSGQFAKQGLDWNRLQDGSVEKQSTTSGGWQETSLYYLGRLVYNYSDKYILTGTLRRDGFSGFGTNNKFALFPSVALGWRLTEEGFLKDKMNWLDYAKLRISFGENGNRTVSRYQTLAKMSSDFTYTFGGSSALSQTTSSLANPNLKWETTTSLNFGLDYEFFNSRINGALEYYFSSTTDMLYEVPLPNMGGINSIFTNLGEIKNRGIEIAVNSFNIQKKDFSWKSTVSFSRNRNEIISILGKDDDGDGVEDDLIASGLFIGEDISSIYTFNVLGLYQLGDTDIPANSGPGLYRYEDISGPEGSPDGIISSEFDRKIIGYSDPAYRWSLINTFNYKNLSLMIFLNSIQGGKDRYIGRIDGPAGGSVDDNVRRDNYGVEHSKFWWTPQNTDSPFKELFAFDPFQRFRYFQRNFIRLQDVSLSYRIDSTLIKRIGVSGLNIFVSGKNLYTWTDWYGLDPETGDGFRASHPLLKNYTCGINLTF